ncbi:unnamed protein product [Linum tenue]|uniref:Reverse transcriptase domain-containing protein n=1 Tax=Linum tenue TaxID=586396 RepID=A0AAV0NT31_9ROSI|nr:unnamed protein product [Linum tenue]
MIKRILMHHLPEDVGFLCDPVTTEEVRKIVFGMARGKAPSPGGFSFEFFHENWSVVSNLVIQAVQKFFLSGRLLKEVNNTIIALMPKIPNHDTMKPYRPISCSNFFYKCISKSIACRLGEVPPSIISHNQSAFIKGRMISDNIILAHEMVKWYGR